jgi:hypothetical protein
MRLAGVNDPKQSHKGRAYNEAFSKWLSTNTAAVCDRDVAKLTVRVLT